jgi:tyrosyl-tRNA synthetase
MTEVVQADLRDLQIKDEVAMPPDEKPHPSGLTLEERYQLCRSVAEECISEEELRRLLNKPMPIAYDGFEPSGAHA